MLNESAVQKAQAIVDAATADFLADHRGNWAGVVKSAAGGGKTYLVRTVAGATRHRGLSVVVATPTNEQAFQLVDRIARGYPGETVTFVPARNVRLPDAIAQLPNVAAPERAADAFGAPLIVGTFAKLGDAFLRGDLRPADRLVGDECYQEDAAGYYAVADIAKVHLLVGDPGQINPFATIAADRWRGLPEDPLQTAPDVLLRNHPDTPLYLLPVTRRLDPRAVPVARAFYPEHEFEAAVLPNVRQMRLLPGVASDPRTRLLDQSLDLAAREGWAHLELREAAVLADDPETVDLVVDLLVRLGDRAPQVRCEQQPTWLALDLRRIAVGVSHNNQRDLLRARLDAAGLSEVVVSTANKLQGREFDLVIAWHPLAGQPAADEFHLDPGRLCVLLTRHRHGCIVVGRAGDRALLESVPPPTPAYLGWDFDPVLAGWDAHQAVFARLAPYRLLAV